MKRVALCLLLAAASLAAPLAAQQLAPSPVVEPGHAVLTLTAEGRSLRIPDLAIFNAGVTSQGKTAGEALAANSAAMARVIAELKRSGIAERDIQTSSLSVEPVYTDPNRDAQIAARAAREAYVPPAEPAIPRIVAYRATNNVSVRQRDLRNFGKVIDTLVAAGANQVNGPSFTMDNADAALDEARTDAVRKARDRAQLYARASGLKVVRILTMSESGGYYGPPPVVFARAGVMGAAPPPPPPAPIQPGELQMNASVTITFEMAP